MLKEELLELDDCVFFGRMCLGVEQILDHKWLIHPEELVIYQWQMLVLYLFGLLDLFRGLFLQFVEQVLLVFLPNGLEGLQIEGVDALEHLVHFLNF